MAYQEQKQHECPGCTKAWEAVKDKPLDTKVTFGSIGKSINVNLDWYVWMIIQKAYGKDDNIQLSIKDTRVWLREHKLLRDYGDQKSWSLTKGEKFSIMCGGLKNVKVDHEQQVVNVASDGYGSTFSIPSFHVSCRSDKYTGEPMVGIILYQYDGRLDWHLNGIHCKSGYIVLKLSKNIAHIKGEVGQVHGACYKWTFNESVGSKVVGGGFAYYQGKWKFNSGVFNAGDAYKYHDGSSAMHDIEQKCIMAAVENWKKGTQNTYVKDIKSIQSFCGHHGLAHQ